MRSQRGATLLEALIAVAVLGVGTASVTNLISSINQARQKMSFQTSALELFNRFDSEIRSSTCLVYPDSNVPTALSADPAFFVAPNTWQNAPPPGSRVTTLGDFDGTNAARPLMNGIPIRIEYQIMAVPVILGSNEPPAYDIVVRVRELSRDAAWDGVNTMSRHDVRTWPIRKVCTLRSVAASRGGFP